MHAAAAYRAHAHIHTYISNLPLFILFIRVFCNFFYNMNQWNICDSHIRSITHFILHFFSRAQKIFILLQILVFSCDTYIRETKCLKYYYNSKKKIKIIFIGKKTEHFQNSKETETEHIAI